MPDLLRVESIRSGYGPIDVLHDLSLTVADGEIVAMIGAEFPLEPVEAAYRGEVAERYRYLDDAGEIGVISSVTQAFCADCNRARLSTEGQLYLCLFASQGHDLRSLLRNGVSSDTDIASKIQNIWQSRSDNYSELRASGQAPKIINIKRVEMSYIGG